MKKQKKFSKELGDREHIFRISVKELGGDEEGVMTGGTIEFQGNPGVLGHILSHAMNENQPIKDMIQIALLEQVRGSLDGMLDELKEMGEKLKENDLEQMLKDHKGQPN